MDREPSHLILLQQAVALHQAGRLDAAEALYQSVLKIDGWNVDALNLLGVIANDRGHLEKAKKLFQRAIAAGPQVPDVHFNFGNLLSRMDDAEGALAAYGRAVKLKPGFASAQVNMGALLFKRDQIDEAAACFRQALASAPQDASAHFNLGRCLLRQSRTGEAEVSLKRAVELDPSHADAYVQLANLCSGEKRAADAIHYFRLAIALNPKAEYHSNLGALLRDVDDIAGALAAHETAIALSPDVPIILHNYASALHGMGRIEEAEAFFHKSLTIDPRFMQGHASLAKIYEHQGRFKEAVAALECALELLPDDPTLICRRALLLLATQNLKEGWRDYECRSTTSHDPVPRPPVPPVYWRGEDLRGKRIIVWTEQGLGDEILHAGMIGEIIQRAARCIIECSPRMVPVFARSFPTAEVKSLRAAAMLATLPGDVDYQIGAASLGQFFRNDVAQFPNHPNYLKADPVRVGELRARYRARANGNLIVGLAWRSARLSIGDFKSADLSSWEEVLRARGVTFVNLQYGDTRAELAAVNRTHGIDVIEDGEIDPLVNMDAFFAQVAAMDLVISTSNTAVHVAGSLGIPVWMLVADGPGTLWYWFLGRSDSPWYPALRIFRNEIQYVKGDLRPWWRVGVTRIGQELRHWISARRHGDEITPS